MFPAKQRYVAHVDIWNEKTSFNPFPGTAETKRRNSSEDLLAVDLERQTLGYFFILYKNSDTLA